MKITLTVIYILISIVLFAQKPNTGTFKVRKVKVQQPKEEAVFKGDTRYQRDFIPQQEPKRIVIRSSYPGGKKAMLKFISDNLIFPPSEKVKKITGTVQIGFTIKEDGSLSEVQILSGQSKLKNEEAARVVNLMPKWNPKKINGINVISNQSILIKFKL